MQQKENVVVKKSTSEHLAPGGKLASSLSICPPCGGSTAVRRGRRVVKSVFPLWRGWHVVPGEGVLTKEHFISTPSSPLRGTSPARGEVNGGFTLIELLVVVLIIGILAAVALPQYKKAVIKSRVATILPVLSSIIQAQEVYYLANGQYTDSAELTDSQLPATCTKIDDTGMWKCGNNWLVDIDPGVVLANYCPKHNSSFADCKPNRDFQIGFGSAHSNPNSTHPSPNARSCWKPNNSSNYGEEICKALGKPVPGTNTYELY